ncbi:MAG: AAA family ATPase [Chloroflexi bacterium]|nr:AAA family ATPase [Actinomycetota bacterium]MBA3740326.1 AAA family ATPase [Chloroflexota bacterium]
MTLQRTREPVRELTADDLGIGASAAIRDHGSSRPDDPALDPSDTRLAETRELLKVYGGVIFSGPPGTSKSWYAAKIGSLLADRDPARVSFVQFHPSYQYEDFIQGLVPRGDGSGFERVDKYFLAACRRAERDPSNNYVLVIDELSRADPGRVFGEALTYVERSKRGLPFSLASGEDAVVPPNVVILATMNPNDRGVDEVDAAFERRFAKIAMDPDPGIMAEFLGRNGVNDPLRRRMLGFFNKINRRALRNPLAAVGHTFFMEVDDQASLRRLWDYQLRFLFDKAYRLDPDELADIRADWQRIFDDEEPETSAEGDAPAHELDSE